MLFPIDSLEGALIQNPMVRVPIGALPRIHRSPFFIYNNGDLQ